MARIANTSQRQLDITLKGKLFQIPRGQNDGGTHGYADVDDELLTWGKVNDPVLKSLFESGELMEGTGRMGGPSTTHAAAPAHGHAASHASGDDDEKKKGTR